MAVSSISGKSLATKRLFPPVVQSQSASFVEPTPPVVPLWTRPLDWLTIPSVPETEEKVFALVAILPGNNYIAFNATGNYSINWGDGTTENFNSGVQAEKIIHWDNIPSNTITTDGFKQILVTITPQAGVSLLTVNFGARHRTIKYTSIRHDTQLVEIVLSAPNLLSINLGKNNTQTWNGSSWVNGTSLLVKFDYLKSIINIRSKCRDFAGLFVTSMGNSISAGAIQNMVLGPETINPPIPCVINTSGPMITTSVPHGLVNGESISIVGAEVSSMGLENGSMFIVTNVTATSFDLLTTFSSSRSSNTTGSAVTSRPSMNTDAFLHFGISMKSMMNGALNKRISTINARHCLNMQSFFANSRIIEFNLINTGSVVNFETCFAYRSHITSIPLFDTSGGINFRGMFQGLTSITAVPNFNTSNGTNFMDMFSSCGALIKAPLLDTSKGINFSQMFTNCSKLSELPVYNTSNGTDFSAIFNNCSSLTSIPNWNFEKGLLFNNAFVGCFALQTIPFLALPAATNVSFLFSSCSSLRNVGGFDLPVCLNFSFMFTGCRNLKEVPLFDTSKGTNFSGMFQNCSEIKTIPLFNTSEGINFSNMMSECWNLEQFPLINTAKGTNFISMFSNCMSLTTIPTLNTSNGTSFGGMFLTCRSLKVAPPINLSNATAINALFANCIELESAPTYNTPKITTMDGMLNGCVKLKEFPELNFSLITDWNISFSNMPSLERILVKGAVRSVTISDTKMGATAINDFIFNLGVPQTNSINLTIGSGNLGMDTVITASGTISGKTFTLGAANSNIVPGMIFHSPYNIQYNDSLHQGGQQCSKDDPTNRIQAFGNNPELVEGDIVVFNSGTPSTMIGKIYYARNISGNYFQLSETPTGSIVNVSSIFPQYFRVTRKVVSVSGTTVTLDKPWISGTSTSTSGTFVFRTGIRTDVAFIRNWVIQQA